MIAWYRIVALAVVYPMLSSGWIRGAELYVLRFRTDRNYSDPSCKVVNWRDELLFHNRTNADKVVVNLAATAGAARPPGQILIPAGRTVSTAAGNAQRDLGGDPFGPALLVNRLSVPDGVVVSSRADVFGPPVSCGAPPTSTIYSYGHLPLPVFRSLAAPNERQIHLATDLGVQPRHTNVIVYNAGSAVATARVEFRAGCDDSLLGEQIAAVGPNSVVQIQGLTDNPLGRSCFGAGLTPDLNRYVVVTVDEQSLSHVTTISDEFSTPTIGATVSSLP